jgi:predicted nucleic acid-binding protein
VSQLIALLDASVLFPAAPRDTLLRAAEATLFQPRWSEEILQELGRNLIADAGLREDQVRRLLAAIHRRFPLAAVTEYEEFVNNVTNHPKDRHVLSAAISAHAQVIVTNNLRHFPANALDPFGIQAQSADSFLHDLFNAHPASIVLIIHQQAAALVNPPVTVEALVDLLAVQAPKFALALRQQIL